MVHYIIPTKNKNKFEVISLIPICDHLFYFEFLWVNINIYQKIIVIFFKPPLCPPSDTGRASHIYKGGEYKTGEAPEHYLGRVKENDK